MPKLHLIEKGTHPENLRSLDPELIEWESGFWAIAPATAERLVGGKIFLHAGQHKLSHFGGDTTVSASWNSSVAP